MTLTREQALVELTKPGGPFEIGTADVSGVPVRVFAKAPSSLRAILESSRAHGDRDFLVYGADRFTFVEHLRVVGGLARWLAAERGVGKGDRVAIGMRNYPEWVMTFWATQALGAVAVPLNAWWTAQELRYALDDSGATVAVLDGERYQRLGADLDDLGLPTVVVRHDGELADGAVHWGDVLARLDREAGLPQVEIVPEDTATIIYTSGTTGAPKGAIGTHRNHVTNYLNTALGGALAAMTAPPQDRAADADPAPSPCSLQTYPYFHIGGITGLYTSTGFGVKVVLMYKWDLEEALKLIERERVTSFAAVPTILREMFDSPLLEKYDVSSLGTVASGGAPVPPDLVDRVDRQFSSRAAPSNGYGLTETTSAVTLHRGADYLQRPTSVGRPLPVVEVRVVDPATGQDRPDEQVGELWFRGPNVVAGYWNKPEATAEAFTEGWFHSGDLGHLDDDGFVYVVDRLKDVVIRGGENVYCAEVEAAIFEHPAVADVAVVGLPHPQLGEAVAAIVQPKEGATISEEDLREHVRARLAHFKVPEHVAFRYEPLPRTATGKVLKRDLRDELTRG